MKKEKNIKHKILIVEDDDDFLYILKTKFESDNFQVVTAKNAIEAINIVEQENPELILSDVLMQEMNGVEMAKAIRKSHKNIFIIFMTNLTDINYINETKNLENFESIIKSNTKISEIVEKVKNKLNS